MKNTLTLIELGLLAGRWDFGLCSQQQLVCVILLFHLLSSLINTAVSVQRLQETQGDQRQGGS